ncbi:hypothetical protein B0T14DRAFT_501916 [Immersiella caudata]|uniref:Uncharacterized protein n=1 Tax=Immersiella caudata TaxID=314043 RepID=A0AA40CAV7_9PEZI|nr:hypothetical protein B0T14DRAFT_501916 [Immersiella caudata]
MGARTGTFSLPIYLMSAWNSRAVIAETKSPSDLLKHLNPRTEPPDNTRSVVSDRIGPNNENSRLPAMPPPAHRGPEQMVEGGVEGESRGRVQPGSQPGLGSVHRAAQGQCEGRLVADGV